MSRLHLGVVGCGEIARYMVWMARLIPEVRVVACCADRPERAAAFARRHRIPYACADLAEMLARPDIHAVYLAVPHDLHYPMALAAAEAGKAVFLEKPLASIAMARFSESINPWTRSGTAKARRLGIFLGKGLKSIPLALWASIIAESLSPRRGTYLMHALIIKAIP